MSEIFLPWPDSGLLPNKRLHWAKKAKLVKAYREECSYLTYYGLGTQLLLELRAAAANGSRIALFVDFFRPDRRKRDEDNIMASFKAGIDGIADGLRIDDSKFKYIPFVRDEVISGGKVRVRFSVLPGGSIDK